MIPIMLCLYALVLMVPLAIVAGVVVLGPATPQLLAAAAAGAYHGFFLVLAAVPALISTLTESHSLLFAAVTGALGGAAVAWVRTALRVSDTRSSTVSVLFSPELWQKNGVELVVLMLMSAGVGYLVASAFSAVGLIGTPTHAGPETVFAAATIVFGGGGYPGGDDFPGLIAFIAVLFAMMIAGGIIGAGLGGMLGSISGIGVWAFDAAAAVHGAAGGATVRLLLGGRRKSRGPDSLLQYVVLGAMTGAVEGMLSGAIVGAIIGPFDRLLS
jgi:hypothetical protein